MRDLLTAFVDYLFVFTRQGTLAKHLAQERLIELAPAFEGEVCHADPVVLAV